MDDFLAEQVRARACNACEYCLMPQTHYPTVPFPIDHIIAQPRRHKWNRHFCWDGPFLIGRTAIGRATITVLAMNDPAVIEVRKALIEEGKFPP